MTSTRRRHQDPRRLGFDRLYIIPTDADTIIAYAAIFDRGGSASVTDPLIESIHFVR